MIFLIFVFTTWWIIEIGFYLEPFNRNNINQEKKFGLKVEVSRFLINITEIASAIFMGDAIRRLLLFYKLNPSIETNH